MRLECSEWKIKKATAQTTSFRHTRRDKPHRFRGGQNAIEARA